MTKKFNEYLKEEQSDELSSDVKKEVSNQYVGTFKTFIIDEEDVNFEGDTEMDNLSDDYK